MSRPHNKHLSRLLTPPGIAYVLFAFALDTLLGPEHARHTEGGFGNLAFSPASERRSSERSSSERSSTLSLGGGGRLSRPASRPGSGLVVSVGGDSARLPGGEGGGENGCAGGAGGELLSRGR